MREKIIIIDDTITITPLCADICCVYHICCGGTALISSIGRMEPDDDHRHQLHLHRRVGFLFRRNDFFEHIWHEMGRAQHSPQPLVVAACPRLLLEVPKILFFGSKYLRYMKLGIVSDLLIGWEKIRLSHWLVFINYAFSLTHSYSCLASPSCIRWQNQPMCETRNIFFVRDVLLAEIQKFFKPCIRTNLNVNWI